MTKHGGKRRGAGRKKKAEEQELIDLLSPYDSAATSQLVKAVKNGDAWAIKLFFEYRYGKPKQQLDVTSDGEKIEPPPIVFYKPDQSEFDEWDKSE